jgi:hypothetical protein
MKIPFLNIEITRSKREVVKDPVVTPGNRSSVPEGKEDNPFSTLREDLEIIMPEWDLEIIPKIRAYTKSNPNFSQAIKNVINLGNTGHKIKFDPNVNPEQVDKMRKHLLAKGKQWGKQMGAAGVNGITNRMIYQIMVSGSLAMEKVIANDYSTISQIPLIRPEKIRWILSKRDGLYKPYEFVKNPLALSEPVKRGLLMGQYKKLNYDTLIYYGLYSDSELPYGIPPYSAALAPASIQAKMLDNISFIVEQVGLLGFLQVLLDKESKRADENISQYTARMEGQLDEAARRISKGLRNGINVGFKGDSEFEFHSATKSVSGVGELFKENELQFLSGLLQDGSLLGRDYGASEAQITVVFMKMVSEFKNIQSLVGFAWEDIYTTELLLAGFKFDYLNVQFKTSTLQDEVKWQQGQQYKIANIQEKYLSGWISQDTAADEMDYETPDQPLPRDIPSLAQKIVQQQERQKQKNTDAKKTRDTNKPVEKSVKDKPRGRKSKED